VTVNSVHVQSSFNL